MPTNPELENLQRIMEQIDRLQRATEAVEAQTDAVTIREGTDNRTIARFEHTNGRWEEVPVANIQTNQAVPVMPGNQVVEQHRPIISVIVRRQDYGGWAIGVRKDGASLPLPEIGVIKSLLPPEWKRLLGGRHSRRRRSDYYLQQALDSGLPTQVLHDALQAWAFNYVNATVEAASDTPMPTNQDDSFLLKAQPATIFVGGKSFKLVPTGERDNTNIYRHIRDKAKAVAQIEVQAKLDKAQTDARILVAEAQDRVRVARIELDQLRASMGNQAPEWARLSGRPLKQISGRWYIGMYVSTYLEDIRYRVDNWAATLHWNPIHPNGYTERYYVDRPMLMWLPLLAEGRYTVGNIIGERWHTVHNTTTGTCMELQGLPPAIRNTDNLIALERAISRGMRVINFNSPLSMQLDWFYPLFAEQLPDMVKKLITGNASFPAPDRHTNPIDYLTRANEGRPADNPRISWDRLETDREELNYTFQVTANTAGNG